MRRITPLKAIRAKCLDCSGFQTSEVRKCWNKECALYPFRMGHKPKEVSGDTQGGLAGKSATKPMGIRAGGHIGDYSTCQN